jgi:hypothetical protein
MPLDLTVSKDSQQSNMDSSNHLQGPVEKMEVYIVHCMKESEYANSHKPERFVTFYTFANYNGARN